MDDAVITNIALLIARLLLAAVFGIGGLGKLVDQRGARQTLIDFGIPTAVGGALGALLPVCELAVAVALIPTMTAWWGCIGALALLCLFLVGISFNLARGRRPNCRCFGQLEAA